MSSDIMAGVISTVFLVTLAVVLLFIIHDSNERKARVNACNDLCHPYRVYTIDERSDGELFCICGSDGEETVKRVKRK